METVTNVAHREPWNKGKIVGQKAPFKLRDVRAPKAGSRSSDLIRQVKACARCGEPTRR